MFDRLRSMSSRHFGAACVGLVLLILFLGNVALIGEVRRTLAVHQQHVNKQEETIEAGVEEPQDEANNRKKRAARQVRDRDPVTVDYDDDSLFNGDYSSHLGGGAVFTRWGRNVCPETNTELVYTGWVGGSPFANAGGGANYVCLSDEPVWGRYNEVLDALSTMNGAEYEMKKATDNFPFSNQNAPKIHDHNVPCAVCRSKVRSSVVMIPGRSVCVKDWTHEYDGYLVSAHQTHKGRTMFECMDSDPEANESGFRNEGGALFYSVEGVCGSLPCPPYAAGREISCVVCSK